MTVGELKRRLEKQPDDRPVVVLVEGDGEYLKAYATRAGSAHDALPDPDDHGDDRHNAGTIFIITADLEG